MTQTLASLAALELPTLQPGAAAPEWIHLVPKGEFRAYDGRGPWHYENGRDVIAASFAARPRIHIDLNHSTETAAKMGLDAPAVGYVLEMEERETGIWARIDWTERGRSLIEDRAYWGVSPVISYDKTGLVRSVARAALTNDPAVATLTPLSTKETTMSLSNVAKKLGLSEDASEADILEALDAKDTADANQAALSGVGEALGLEGTASLTQIVAVAKGMRAAGADQTAQLAALQAQVDKLEGDGKKKVAEAFVDAAIQDKRAGVKPEREAYVALHMEDPALAERLINGLPKLGQTHTTDDVPEVQKTAALSAEQVAVANLLGVSVDDMAKTLNAEKKEAL